MNRQQQSLTEEQSPAAVAARQAESPSPSDPNEPTGRQTGEQTTDNAVLSPGFADLSNSQKSCRTINDDAARLKCYDALSAATVPAEQDGDVISEWSGTGTQTTRPFHVDGPWEPKWTTTGAFSATLYRVGRSEMVDLLANQVGTTPGSSYVPGGGNYYISFSGMDQWTARAIRVPAEPAPQTDAVDDDALADDTGEHSDLPACDAPGMDDELIKVIQNSPLGQLTHLQVLHVREITKTETKSGVDICHARVITTGGEQKYQFHFTRVDGGLYILAKPDL